MLEGLDLVSELLYDVSLGLPLVVHPGDGVVEVLLDEAGGAQGEAVGEAEETQGLVGVDVACGFHLLFPLSLVYQQQIPSLEGGSFFLPEVGEHLLELSHAVAHFELGVFELVPDKVDTFLVFSSILLH